jgi:hypothetical protein
MPALLQRYKLRLGSTEHESVAGSATTGLGVSETSSRDLISLFED